ncbi:MAG: phosphosulfolactate synthase [Bacteroidales bacterium]|jgi:phosphosulfolactate synthase|nr:phosphosulfolactate synthase [Bacteroidales bacterium]
MNYNLPHVPTREGKPRTIGQTMVIDKGLSVVEAQNMVDAAADYIDYAKIGFGTALITKNLHEKIKVYSQADITPYFGGTLFELFIVRNMFDEFQKFLDTYNIGMVEVSDGSIELDQEKKLHYIQELSKNFTVISEVGSKEADKVLSPETWINLIKSELDAGSIKVITEARESGTIGIFNKDGSANKILIDTIINNIDISNIMWEAPQKNQQALFVKLLGESVNLGNIATNEVIALEALRLGLRGDTFFQFLGE